MASWNEFKTDVERVANKAIKKTGELADSASISLKIKVAGAKLSSAYEKLGKLTYKQLRTSESQAEKISEVIEVIDALHESIKALRQKAEEMKKERESEKAEQTDEINEVESEN